MSNFTPIKFAFFKCLHGLAMYFKKFFKIKERYIEKKKLFRKKNVRNEKSAQIIFETIRLKNFLHTPIGS